MTNHIELIVKRIVTSCPVCKKVNKTDLGDGADLPAWIQHRKTCEEALPSLSPALRVQAVDGTCVDCQSK